MTRIDLNLAINIFLKKDDELLNLYSDIPEALENNYNFHLRFNFKPKKSKPILPSIANNQIILLKTNLEIKQKMD